VRFFISSKRRGALRYIARKPRRHALVGERASDEALAGAVAPVTRTAGALEHRHVASCRITDLSSFAFRGEVNGFDAPLIESQLCSFRERVIAFIFLGLQSIRFDEHSEAFIGRRALQV